MARPRNPRGELDESVLLRLTADEKADLRVAAALHDCSQQELLRMALDQLVERGGPRLKATLRSFRATRAALSRRAKTG